MGHVWPLLHDTDYVLYPANDTANDTVYLLFPVNLRRKSWPHTSDKERKAIQCPKQWKSTNPKYKFNSICKCWILTQRSIFWFLLNLKYTFSFHDHSSLLSASKGHHHLFHHHRHRFHHGDKVWRRRSSRGSAKQIFPISTLGLATVRSNCHFFVIIELFNIIIIFTNVLSPPASSINTGVTQHSQVVATISNFTSHHQRHRHHRRNNYRDHHHNYHSQHYLMDQSNGLPFRHSSAHLKLIMMTGLLNII